jgi:methanogenic corrinoid protein MtbC1
MIAHLADGLSAAEAARTVPRDVRAAEIDDALPAEHLATEQFATLRQALYALDDPAAQAILDRLLSEFWLASVLRDVLVPYLADLGERWERGTVSVAQEHFASNVIRGLLALAGAAATRGSPRLLAPDSWPVTQ